MKGSGTWGGRGPERAGRASWWGPGGPRQPLSPDKGRQGSDAAGAGRRGAAAIFSGTPDGAFDTRKGRVSVPGAFRKVLAKLESDEIVVRYAVHTPCLQVWAKPTFDAQIAQRCEGIDSFHPDYARRIRPLTMHSETLQYDSEGRVVIPKALFERAGLGSKVTFVGCGLFFEIWDPARLQAHLEAEEAAQ